MDALTEKSQGEPAVAQVRACLGEAANLAGIARGELAAPRQRAEADVFNLVAVGEFKRAKSGDTVQLSRSRFPTFTKTLASFLMQGKANALAACLAKRLLHACRAHCRDCTTHAVHWPC